MKNTINIYKEKLFGIAGYSNVNTTTEPKFIDVDSMLLDDLKLKADRQQLIDQLTKAHIKIEQQKNMILTLIVYLVTFVILIGLALAR